MSDTPYRPPYLGKRLVALLENIRVGWKLHSVKNIILKYYTVKSFRELIS
jgi:hypothetical protein